MIDDHRHRQTEQQLFHLHQLFRRHVALDVPAKSGNAAGQRHHFIGAHRIAQAELHPHPAHAGGMQAFQLRIGDRAVDHADRAAILAHLRQHIQQQAIVGAVGGRLHHHIAAGAQLLLQRAIIADRGIGRRQHRLGIIRKARIVNVMMAIGGAIGHRERDFGILGQSRPKR